MAIPLFIALDVPVHHEVGILREVIGMGDHIVGLSLHDVAVHGRGGLRPGIHAHGIVGIVDIAEGGEGVVRVADAVSEGQTDVGLHRPHQLRALPMTLQQAVLMVVERQRHIHMQHAVLPFALQLADIDALQRACHSVLGSDRHVSGALSGEAPRLVGLKLIVHHHVSRQSIDILLLVVIVERDAIRHGGQQCHLLRQRVVCHIGALALGYAVLILVTHKGDGHLSRLGKAVFKVPQADVLSTEGEAAVAVDGKDIIFLTVTTGDAPGACLTRGGDRRDGCVGLIAAVGVFGRVVDDVGHTGNMHLPDGHECGCACCHSDIGKGRCRVIVLRGNLITIGIVVHRHAYLQAVAACLGRSLDAGCHHAITHGGTRQRQARHAMVEGDEQLLQQRLLVERVAEAPVVYHEMHVHLLSRGVRLFRGRHIIYIRHLLYVSIETDAYEKSFEEKENNNKYS